MNNYEYCANWAKRRCGNGRILDYGCGAGELVALMRSNGLDAHGCDVFFDGGNFTEIMVPKAVPYIHRMTDDRIPFPDETFDVLVSNQVIEHVPRLDVVVNEMARVLKPGGVSLHLFPYRGTLMEWHAMIPLLHRLPPGAFRAYYATFMSILPGLGLPLRGESRLTRFRNKCKWVDDWTHYRTREELHAAFSRRFSIDHVEADWFSARVRQSAMLPSAIRSWVATRLAGMAVVLHKL